MFSIYYTHSKLESYFPLDLLARCSIFNCILESHIYFIEFLRSENETF